MFILVARYAALLPSKMRLCHATELSYDGRREFTSYMILSVRFCFVLLSVRPTVTYEFYAPL